jgi:drug/metabolite transporter (DMT)-like permease
MTARLTPRLALLLTLPPVMWAGNAVVGRLAAGQVPPLALNALRWLLALAILLPLGWRALGTPAARAEVLRRWRPLALLGLLGVGCYNALQYMALTTSSAMNVTLIASSLPVWMLAIGALFYRERPTKRSMVGAALSLAGVLVVLARGDATLLAQVRLVAGEARPDWDWAAFLLVQTMFGVVWGGAFAVAEAVVAPAPILWSGWVVLALAYVAIGPSLIAYRSWGLGVVSAGPAMAAFFGNLTPLFAAILSAAVLGEAPHLYHVLAFALIVAGIVVSARR